MNTLVDASLYGGAFVLAVGLLCAVVRRLPAWVRSWLWGIACAQFLVRLVLSVPVPILAAPGTEAPLGAPGKHFVIDAPERSASRPADPSPVPNLIITLWGLGVAVGLATTAYRWHGARRLVRRGTPVNDPGLLNPLAELTEGWKVKPRLLESSRVKCPLLVGILRPAIVVPDSYGKDHDEPEVRMAFAHELAHIRRGDPWMSLVVTATQITFFFHPLAWWAGRESALAREEACDLEVLRLSEESPTAYAHFLLKSAQARPPVAGLGAAYGYRNLRRRITMLKGLTNASLSSPRRTWLGLIAAGLAASLPWTVVGQSAPATSVEPAKPAATAKRPSKARAATKPVQKKPGRTPKAGIAAPATAAQEAKAAPVRPLPGMASPARAANAAPFGSVIAPVMEAEGTPVMAAVSVEEATEQVSEVKFGPIEMGAPLQRNVTAHFVGADIRASLLKVLTGSGASFVIKAKIQRGTLTGKFNEMPIHEVLDAIFQGIDQPLTYRVDRNVIYIVDQNVVSGGFGGGVPAVPGMGGLGGGIPGGAPAAPASGGFGGGSSDPTRLPGGAGEAKEVDPTKVKSAG